MIFSCDNKYPDYDKRGDGVYMKLLYFEDEEKSYHPLFHAVASIEVIDGENLLYKRYKEDIINLENNEFSFLIKEMNEGDSASFMVSAAKIQEAFKPVNFNKITSEYVEVNIKIYQYYTKGEHLSASQGYDKEMMEQLILKKYIKECRAKPTYEGLYVEQLKKGHGKKIEKGDVITIAYKGYFINRLEFDNISGATAFTFTYGTPGQVIKGLDLAINGMKNGEKSKIIITSQLAFGEGGSTTRVVPPFTTVIYEIEIVNVK